MEILERMIARDDLRSRDPTSPALQQVNDEITRTTNEHRRNTWRQFVEIVDHRTDSSKLWRTIKAINGKSPPKAENEAITFDDTQVSSPKQIANYFNRQFTTFILISLQMAHTINPIPQSYIFNLKKTNLDRYRMEIEDKLSKIRLPSNCQNEKRSCVPSF